MTKPLVVIVPHNLTRPEVVARLKGGMGQLRAQLGGKVATIEDQWTNDAMTFRVGAMGQTIKGRLDVEDQSVRVEVELPFILAAIANTIRDKIQAHGTKMLEKK